MRIHTLRINLFLCTISISFGIGCEANFQRKQ